MFYTLITKNSEWKRIASSLSFREKLMMIGKINEVFSHKYFYFIPEESQRTVELKIEGLTKKFILSLNINIAEDIHWIDRLNHYLGVDGDRIMDSEKIIDVSIDPKKIARYWAFATWSVSQVDLGRILGEASFDLSSSDDANILEMWLFTSTLTGYIASSTNNLPLRANPYRYIYEMYRSGARPMFFRGPLVALPLSGKRKGRYYCIYRITKEAKLEAIDRKDVLSYEIPYNREG
jgi:hypothetical protein